MRTITILLSLSLSISAAAAQDLYSIEKIGLLDSEHTNPSTSFQFSWLKHTDPAGIAAGTANRYDAAGTNRGESAWLFDGTTTTKVGLTGPGYVNVYNIKNSDVRAVNAAGQAAGTSVTYAEDADFDNSGFNFRTGQHVWFYDGTTSIAVGLFDSDHTNPSYNGQETEFTALSAGGDVLGTTRRYICCGDGNTNWLYDGATTHVLGLFDTEHTIPPPSNNAGSSNNTAVRMNANGLVIGEADRWGLVDSVPTPQGHSGWLFDGTTTIKIGLTGPDYTKSDGRKTTEVIAINSSGTVAGYSRHYASALESVSVAWTYSGGTHTIFDALTDPQHTRFDGMRNTTISHLLDNGMMAGTQVRYNGAYNGQGKSGWFYNGTTTVRLGLINATHRAPGQRSSDVKFLNEAGFVVGTSRRYFEGEPTLGQSAWVYDGSTTTQIGLYDAEHTRDFDQYVGTEIYQMNAVGQVIGQTPRYENGSDFKGRTAWFYDGTTTVRLDAFVTPDSEGERLSEPKYVSDDGLVIGINRQFDALDNYVDVVFAYSTELGMIDLGLRIDESFDDEGWTALATTFIDIVSNWQVTVDVAAERITSSGPIFGMGEFGPTGGSPTNGKMAYRLTPIEEPLDIIIDIQPWFTDNVVDPDSDIDMPVGIMTTNVADGEAVDFDATQVDPASLRFGVGESPNTALIYVTDLDSDADSDLVVAFDIQDAGVLCEDTSLTMTGETYSGTEFTGTDFISTPECETATCHP